MQQQFKILLRATQGLQAETAARNLKFFVDIGYLEDPTGQIRKYAGRGEAPWLLNTCKPGFVWRVARPSDLVCVPPEGRDQVSSENEQAAARRVAGSYTCISGYVWREAFPGDTVCVPPARRGETQQENAMGPSRTVVAD